MLFSTQSIAVQEVPSILNQQGLGDHFKHQDCQEVAIIKDVPVIEGIQVPATQQVENVHPYEHVEHESPLFSVVYFQVPLIVSIFFDFIFAELFSLEEHQSHDNNLI